MPSISIGHNMNFIFCIWINNGVILENEYLKAISRPFSLLFWHHSTDSHHYQLPSTSTQKLLHSSNSFHYTMCHQEIAANGWTSVAANAGAIFGDQPFINKPGALALTDIKFPFDDPTVAKTLKYAKETLHPETFNHSMRVYFYGMLGFCI